MKKQVVKYSVNDAAIAKMSSIYLNLTIDGLEDSEGAKDVHAARMVMVKHRTSVDKLRKETNADAQKFIKTNNTNAKKLIDLMAPIETHLSDEEKKIADEKKRIEEEEKRIEIARVKARLDRLIEVDVVLPFFDVAMMTDEEFAELFSKSLATYEDKKWKLKEEQKAREAENKKLAEERKEIEKMQIEQAERAKIIAEQEAEIWRQKDEIEAEKREAEGKKAKLFAEKEALEKIEKQKQQEIDELAEAKRQEELLPDKEKLSNFAVKLLKIRPPELEAKKAKEIADAAIVVIAGVADDIVSESEKL